MRAFTVVLPERDIQLILDALGEVPTKHGAPAVARLTSQLPPEFGIQLWPPGFDPTPLRSGAAQAEEEFDPPHPDSGVYLE